MFYIVITNLKSSESTPLPKVCTTSRCMKAAANILEKMDPSINPCDNFYKFTCGKFLNSTIIHFNTPEINSFTAIEDDTLRKVGVILSENMSKQIKPFQQGKNFFKLCMNRGDNIEEMNAPILEILNKLGGWPVTKGDAWKEKDIDWITLSAMLVKTGFPSAGSYFIALTFMKDSKNSKQSLININSPLLYLPFGSFKKIDDMNTKIYYKTLVERAVLFGAEKKRAEKELLESLKFQIDLTNIAETVNTQMAIESNNMTIEEMMKKWPTINWMTYINSILSIVPNITIDKNKTVIVYNPSFITKFEKLINSTPRRVIVNYAFSRIVQGSLNYLRFGYTKHDKNQTDMKNNSKLKYCINTTVHLLPGIVTALFVQNYIDNNVKHEVIDIAANIKKQLIKSLQQIKELDYKSRKNVLEKMSSMDYYVGYPDGYLNNNYMTERYRDLQLEGRNFFHDVLNISRFNTMFIYRTVMDKNSVLENWLSVTNINAYYSRNNHLALSSGLLQPPFFNNKQPAYMNYGTIGAVIGHEIVHSIDDFRTLFNKNKNKINWTNSSEIIIDKVSCIANQYSNYTVEEVQMKLNGTLTEIENIADNIGVLISYLAYKDWLTRHKPEPTLPGLDYTSTQMFWISMSNMWCSKLNSQFLNYTIKHSTHSPSEFRILGTFSNIPEFSKDFNCPLGSPMNPLKKCKIL